jgi:hypothetical protein
MAANLIDVRQRPRFSRLLLRQALLQCGNQIDNIAAGRLGPWGVAFLSLRLVFDQGTGVTQYMNSGGTIDRAADR